MADGRTRHALRRRDGHLRHHHRCRTLPERDEPGRKDSRRGPRGIAILPAGEPGPDAVEGVGEDFYPGTITSREMVDQVIQVDDREVFPDDEQPMREEGLFVGGSCGMAVVAAVRAARGVKSGLCCYPTPGATTSRRSSTTSGSSPTRAPRQKTWKGPYRVFGEG